MDKSAPSERSSEDARRQTQASRGEPMRLVMWGPGGAGKTVFLAQLCVAPSSERTDWETFPTDGSVAFATEMRSTMNVDNEFPKVTQVGAVEEIVYCFTHQVTDERAELSFEDRPGIDYVDLELDTREKLAAADGLVLLFDPTVEPNELLDQVWRTLAFVHVRDAGTKDDRPIAVCMSKADTFIETPSDLRRAHEHPEEFVREHVEADLDKALADFCKNYRLFPVSAIGVRLQHGVVQPLVFFDEMLTPRVRSNHNSQAINLMEPFAWLLGELTGP